MDEREREREREAGCGGGGISNSKTLFHKDCSLGSIRNLTNSPCYVNEEKEREKERRMEREREIGGKREGGGGEREWGGGEGGERVGKT